MIYRKIYVINGGRLKDVLKKRDKKPWAFLTWQFTLYLRISNVPCGTSTFWSMINNFAKSVRRTRIRFGTRVATCLVDTGSIIRTLSVSATANYNVHWIGGNWKKHRLHYAKHSTYSNAMHWDFNAVLNILWRWEMLKDCN